MGTNDQYGEQIQARLPRGERPVSLRSMDSCESIDLRLRPRTVGGQSGFVIAVGGIIGALLSSGLVEVRVIRYFSMISPALINGKPVVGVNRRYPENLEIRFAGEVVHREGIAPGLVESDAERWRRSYFFGGGLLGVMLVVSGLAVRSLFEPIKSKD